MHTCVNTHTRTDFSLVDSSLSRQREEQDEAMSAPSVHVFVCDHIRISHIYVCVCWVYPSSALLVVGRGDTEP